MTKRKSILSLANLAIIIPCAVLAGGAAYWFSEKGAKEETHLQASKVEIPTQEVKDKAKTGAPIVSELKGFDALDEKQKLLKAFDTFYGKEKTRNIEGEKIEFTPEKIISTNFAKILIVKGEVLDAFPANEGKLYAHYFVVENGEIKKQKSYEPMVEAGSFGNFTDWGISDKFTNNPVIFVEGGGVWQGIMCVSTTLIEITDRGPVELLNIISQRSNDEKKIKGKIENIIKNKSFDIKYTGDNNETSHYIKQGAKFINQSKFEIEC